VYSVRFYGTFLWPSPIGPPEILALVKKHVPITGLNGAACMVIKACHCGAILASIIDNLAFAL